MGRKASQGIKIDRIIRPQLNGDRYVYERTRIYNKETQNYVNTKTKLLGKMRPGSNDKDDLVPTRPRKKKTTQVNSEFKDGQIQASKKHTGMIDIVKYFSGLSGVEQTMRDIIPNDPGFVEKILTCVWYRFATDADSWPGIRNWSTKYAGLLPYKFGAITKNIYGNLFSEIGRHEDIKQGFFMKQKMSIKDGAILALDSSTFETESENLSNARKGVHKDGLVKKVYKIQYFYALEYRKPIAYSLLPGNIPDSETLENALKQLEALNFTNIELVSDNGYCNDSIIALYLQKHQDFLTRIESRRKWISKLIEQNRDFLEHSGEIIECDPKFSGVMISINRSFPFKRKIGQTENQVGSIKGEINVFIYYSSINKAKDDTYFRSQFSKYAEDLKQGRALGEERKIIESFAKKYMQIERDDTGKITEIKTNAAAYKEHMKYNGYLVLLSNKETDLNTALRNFRYREYIEEDIKNYKSHIGGKKPRVWKDDTLDGEIFVQFLSLCMREAYETKINYLKKNLAVPNGDFNHDKAEVLKMEKHLCNWLNDNSMHDILDWFDAIELKEIKERDGQVISWKTETTQRDQMFLEKIGLNNVSIKKDME